MQPYEFGSDLSQIFRKSRHAHYPVDTDILQIGKIR